MNKCTVVLAEFAYESSKIVAIFNKESDAKKAIIIIRKWEKSIPDYPEDGSSNAEHDKYRSYFTTFPYGEYLYADGYCRQTYDLL